MSMNDIKFEEGQSTDQYASQLVKLLQQSVRSSESLARKPLIEHLKRQADGIPANEDPYAATVWQLTGTNLTFVMKALTVTDTPLACLPCMFVRLVSSYQLIPLFSNCICTSVASSANKMHSVLQITQLLLKHCSSVFNIQSLGWSRMPCAVGSMSGVGAATLCCRDL